MNVYHITVNTNLLRLAVNDYTMAPHDGYSSTVHTKNDNAELCNGALLIWNSCKMPHHSTLHGKSLYDFVQMFVLPDTRMCRPHFNIIFEIDVQIIKVHFDVS